MRKGGKHVVQVKGFVVKQSAIRQTAPLTLSEDKDMNNDKDVNEDLDMDEER